MSEATQKSLNSALYWLPRLADSYLGSMVPSTAIVRFEQMAMVEQMEGSEKYVGFPVVLNQVCGCAKLMGYPVFLRSDLASAKHSGPEAYKAARAEDVERILWAIAEDGELKFWLGPDYPQAFLVRQFLDLDHEFTAFNALPIAREWRFFASASGIICAHPYWPAEALEDHYPSTDNWRHALAELHTQPIAEEWDLLTRSAMKAAALCDGAERWSVDFAKDINGKWWLIDMAVMDRSWHWPNCENAK